MIATLPRQPLVTEDTRHSLARPDYIPAWARSAGAKVYRTGRPIDPFLVHRWLVNSQRNNVALAA